VTSNMSSTLVHFSATGMSDFDPRRMVTSMPFGPLRQSFNVPMTVHDNANAKSARALLGHGHHVRRKVSPVVASFTTERSVQRPPCRAEVGAQQGEANGTVTWCCSTGDGADHRSVPRHQAKEDQVLRYGVFEVHGPPRAPEPS